MADTNDAAAAVARDTAEANEPAAKTPAASLAPTNSAAKPDAFAKAFDAAKKELGVKDEDEDEDDAPAPKKPAKKAEEKQAEKPAKKADEKSAKKTDEKSKAKEKAAQDPEDDNDEDDAGDDDTSEDKTKPLEPKRFWSKRRREDFGFLTREQQEAWLAEPVAPDAHWTAEAKATFARLPAEAQEELLVTSRSLEQGYQDKFQALATERKMVSDIKAAVPEAVRAKMADLKMDEVGVFKTLCELQQVAMTNPVQYIANFIRKGGIDVNDIAEALMGGDSANAQRTTQQPAADIEAHPAVRQMRQEIAQLKGHVTGEIQQRQAAREEELDNAVSKVMAARDEGGAARYPYVRLLGPVMADLIEADPETYGSMEPAAQFDHAYKTALSAHPELPQHKAAKPSPADESDEDEADPEEERAEKLRAASTKKSKTPHTAPARPGDPFARAFAAAEKQLGV